MKDYFYMINDDENFLIYFISPRAHSIATQPISWVKSILDYIIYILV